MDFLKKVIVLGTVVTVASLFVVRIPINGWGSVIWVIGVFAAIFIRAPYALAYRRKVSNDEHRGITSERIFGLIVVFGATILPMTHLIFGIFEPVNFTAPTWITLLGSFLLFEGLVLLRKSYQSLGTNWTPGSVLYETHTLVMAGPYKRIRHPMYAAFFVIFLAQAFLLENWAINFGGLLTFGFYYWVLMPKEEEVMLARYGKRYEDYASQTGRVLPKLFM